MKEGLVIKKTAGLFEVKAHGEVFTISARGNLRGEGVFVGDSVLFVEQIEKVLARKNLFVRPPLVNLDRMIIVITSRPACDFFLVDKLIIFCELNGVVPLICINKTDITSNEFVSGVEKAYGGHYKVLKTSAKLCMAEELSAEILGITAFAGQSAVGKSSLINTLLGREKAEIGGLSEKIGRGRQTTRIVQLFEFKDGYIADTAGFSLLDENLFKIKYNKLKDLYPDFCPHTKACKFGSSCLHNKEENCGVKTAVECGIIDKGRYERYIKLLNSLKKGDKGSKKSVKKSQHIKPI